MKITNEVKEFLGNKNSCFQTNMAGIKHISNINMNNLCFKNIYLNSVPFGITLYKIKISRKYYYVLINKDCFNAEITIYNDTPMNRGDYKGHFIFNHNEISVLTSEMIVDSEKLYNVICTLHEFGLKIKG